MTRTHALPAWGCWPTRHRRLNNTRSITFEWQPVLLSEFSSSLQAGSGRFDREHPRHRPNHISRRRFVI